MLDTVNIMQCLNEGSVIMLVGMGIVFSFLAILVLAVMAMAKVVTYLDKICPPPAAPVKTKKAKAKTSSDDEVAVAIAVASTGA